MKLATEFIRLPLRFDTEQLVKAIAGFSEADWRPHPQGHPGNSALPLIAVNGDPLDDAVKGPMHPTAHLERSPYLLQVLAAFGAVLGRTRLMPESVVWPSAVSFTFKAKPRRAGIFPRLPT